MNHSPDFILASASPRRADLLRQIGTRFLQIPAAIDEQRLTNEAPETYVTRMALEKARAGWQYQPERTGVKLAALGADTCVVLDSNLYGKPQSEADAVAMLLSLSGRTHAVLSAVAICRGENSQVLLSNTQVSLRRLDREECRRYWQTGEPRDKAGGYGIQGLGAVFVDKIDGSYSGVVGLPIAETCQLLEHFHIPRWVIG